MTSDTAKLKTLIISAVALLSIIALGLLARSLLAPPPVDQLLSTQQPCNLLQSCHASLGDKSIKLQLISTQTEADKPIHSQAPLQFMVHLTGLEADRVSLQLQGKNMYMGENHYPLQSQQQGQYDVATVLPVCTTGTMTWQAQVRVYTPSGSYQAIFEFDAR